MVLMDEAITVLSFMLGCMVCSTAQAGGRMTTLRWGAGEGRTQGLIAVMPSQFWVCQHGLSWVKSEGTTSTKRPWGWSDHVPTPVFSSPACRGCRHNGLFSSDGVLIWCQSVSEDGNQMVQRDEFRTIIRGNYLDRSYKKNIHQNQPIFNESRVTGVV